jgi:hypothetical protein
MSIKQDLERLERLSPDYKERLLYEMIYEILKELRKLNKK